MFSVSVQLPAPLNPGRGPALRSGTAPADRDDQIETEYAHPGLGGQRQFRPSRPLQRRHAPRVAGDRGAVEDGFRSEPPPFARRRHLGLPEWTAHFEYPGTTRLMQLTSHLAGPAMSVAFASARCPRAQSPAESARSQPSQGQPALSIAASAAAPGSISSRQRVATKRWPVAPSDSGEHSHRSGGTMTAGSMSFARTLASTLSGSCPSASPRPAAARLRSPSSHRGPATR